MYLDGVIKLSEVGYTYLLVQFEGRCPITKGFKFLGNES